MCRTLSTSRSLWTIVAFILASISLARGVDDPHKPGDGTPQPTAATPDPVGAHPSALASAITRAKSRGWPLLILRFSDVETSRWMLGRMWGTYFSLATDGTLTYGSVAVPEPASFGALAGLGMLLVSLRRQFMKA